MKTHTVKSNAKRHAKKLAEKYPGLVVLEPVPVAAGAREWFPAVEWLEWSANGKRAIDVPDEIHNTCMLIRPATGATNPAFPDDFHGVAIELAPKLCNFDQDAVDAILAEGPPPHIIELDTPVHLTASGRAKISARDIAVAAAQLPPPVKSTPEEIAARLAARRERIAAKALEPVKEPTGPKVPRGAIIVDLCSRPGGATQAELEEATGWQRHTLRGYIAGTLRKRGHAIVVKKVKGEPTRYVIDGGAA